MAPATRSVHRKQRAAQPASNTDQSNSWEIVQKTDAHAPAPSPAQDIIDHISPLRDMADRVGREVDHFAQTLDTYNNRLHDDDAYDAAYELASEYKAFANGLVQRLKKRHDAQRLHEMKNDFGKRLPQSPAFGASIRGASLMTTSRGMDDGGLGTNTSLDTLKQWQTEADTWDLFRIMLELRYNPNRDQIQLDKQARLAQLESVNRYTSDAALWEKFTLDDDVSRERYLVLKWLQATADQGENDIDAIAEELESKSGRGGGFWVNGWMETREKIKSAKRARVLSLPTTTNLDVRRSDTNEPLVFELDPDAPARQNRVLEKADAYSERSLWMTCWEMLRRGRSWAEISDWCSQRNQSWRAVSLGASTDSAHDIPLPGLSAGFLWRRLCYTLAAKEGTDEYEAAVYGFLSGDLDSVKRVSRSWDDHLYAFYNSLLLHRFDNFLHLDLPDRATSSIAKRFQISNSTANLDAEGTAREFVGKLLEDKTTADEARRPMKLVQSSLVANAFEDLCLNLSAAIINAPWYQQASAIAPPADENATYDFLEGAIAEDFDALRIVTHMLIMLREVHHPLSRGFANAEILDNIVAAYIQFLSAAGTRDLIPLYASKMSPARAKVALSHVLTEIEDVQDKTTQVRLMSSYGVDPIAVLVEQSQHLVGKFLPKNDAGKQQLPMVEQAADSIYPGQRIKLHFTSAGSGGEGIADHLILFHLVDGYWDVTFKALAYVCRKLLQNGCFLEASHLVRRLPFESLSATKSRFVLGRAINVMDREEGHRYQGNIEKAAKLRLLQKQSQAYYELTLLVRAVEALESWRQTEHEHITKIPPPTSATPKLKKAFEETCAAVEPALTGILLTARDDTEAEELTQIRNTYLPEIVLAYNAFLCGAAHLVSRDHFISSMELASTVADDNTGLAEAIMQAGRMREVVTSFAHTSENMLKLNEIGKNRREKKHKTGANLAVWEIGG